MCKMQPNGNKEIDPQYFKISAPKMISIYAKLHECSRIFPIPTVSIDQDAHTPLVSNMLLAANSMLIEVL